VQHDSMGSFYPVHNHIFSLLQRDDLRFTITAYICGDLDGGMGIGVRCGHSTSTYRLYQYRICSCKEFPTAFVSLPNEASRWSKSTPAAQNVFSFSPAFKNLFHTSFSLLYSWEVGTPKFRSDSRVSKSKNLIRFSGGKGQMRCLWFGI